MLVVPLYVEPLYVIRNLETNLYRPSVGVQRKRRMLILLFIAHIFSLLVLCFIFEGQVRLNDFDIVQQNFSGKK